MFYKNRYKISFIITLILYFLLSTIFLQNLKDLNLQKFSQKEKKIKINLNRLDIKKKKIKEKKVLKRVVKNKIAKKRVKKESKNKIVDKKIQKKYIKKVVTKKAEKIIKTKEKNITKNVNIVKKQKLQNKKSLLSFLKKPDIPSLEEISQSMQNQEISKLYKGEFESFSKGQKEFIKKNLSKIGKITQKYLNERGYPYIALKTNQQGINIVEFYLHPNGDITNLKVIKTSGYSILDKNSIETIKSAYKDYPKPKEITKIRIFVEYKIIY